MAKGDTQVTRRRSGDFRELTKAVSVAARKLDAAINRLADSADDGPAREELAAASRAVQLQPTQDNLFRLEEATRNLRKAGGGRTRATADLSVAAHTFRVACAEVAKKAQKYEAPAAS